MSSSVGTLSTTRDTLGLLWALLELTKPAVTRLVVVTMGCGALLAPGPIRVALLCVAILGTILVVGAANALNMYLERDSDGQMERTRTRPLPTRRLPADVALWFGVSTAVAGLLILTFFVNSLTALLAALALVSYVLIYTPLKRITPFAMHVGAVPGAIPPMMGWTSMTGALEPAAYVLFGILLVWQLPHFCAIAIFRQSEYEQAGVRVLPSVTGIPATKRAIVRYTILMLLVSMLPPLVGLGGTLYTIGAVLLGGVFLGYAIYGLKVQESQPWARSLFLLSMPYLVLLLALLVVTRLS